MQHQKTTKVKTADLRGQALNWAAASILYPPDVRDGSPRVYVNYIANSTVYVVLSGCNERSSKPFNPVWDGNDCMKLMMLAAIAVRPSVEHTVFHPSWVAWRPNAETDKKSWSFGDSPRLAIARCFVLSRTGLEVDIPDVLLMAVPQSSVPRKWSLS